jgi:hypothetical protein
MDLWTVFGSAGSSAITVGVLGWLTRSWISERLKAAIQSEYDMKLEIHKADLKARSDVEIERLKAELSIRATEHQVKFQVLQERRAEILAELYDKLLVYLDATESFVHPLSMSGEPDKSEKWNSLSSSANSFNKFYRHNKITLSPAICEKIDELWKATWFSSTDYMYAINDDDREELFASRKEAWRVLSEETPALLQDHEHEFRRTYGVED